MVCKFTVPNPEKIMIADWKSGDYSSVCQVKDILYFYIYIDKGTYEKYTVNPIKNLGGGGGGGFGWGGVEGWGEKAYNCN